MRALASLKWVGLPLAHFGAWADSLMRPLRDLQPRDVAALLELLQCAPFC
jgi:hypothetical protein